MIVARNSRGLGDDFASSSVDVFGQAMSLWQVFAFGFAAVLIFTAFRKGFK